jgi:hypothetical protein
MRVVLLPIAFLVLAARMAVAAPGFVVLGDQTVRHRAVRAPFPPSGSGIAVTLDETRAASGLISTQGGSLSATAADGSRFTLTLPPGALLSDEQITMTPVTATDRLPFSGGLRAAVQLQPEGLRLLQPATLVIDGAQPLNSGGQRAIGFGYHRTGDEFHLFPAVISGSHAELALMHFSGYGVGSGSDGDVQAQQQRAPASAEDRAQQDIAAGLERFAVLQAWWVVLLGQLQGAATDPHQFDSVFFEFLTWRSLALTEPMAIPLIETGWTYVSTALVSAIQNAQSECVRDPSRVRLMLHLIAIAKQPELQMRSNALSIARPLVSKCLTFELQFDSDMGVNSEGSRYDAHVKSTVTFRMELDQNDKPIVIPASAPLSWVNYSVFHAGCTTQTQTTGSTFTIANDASGTLSRIEFFLDLSDDTMLESRPRDITLTIDHGGPVDREISFTCGDHTEFLPSGPELWKTGWAAFHGGQFGENERISENLTQIRNWDFRGGQLFAQKVYSRSSPPGPPVIATEMTTLQLFHTPLP